MAPLRNRRDFILDSGKAGLAIVAGSSFLASCGSAKQVAGKSGNTGFQQTPLPYSYNALNEAIDGTTMEIHYTKHAASYATNLQNAAKNENVDTSKPLEDVLRKISKYSVAMRNNGGGHYNHEMFWKSMTPNADAKPSGKLATAIDESFGSFETFKTQFSD